MTNNLIPTDAISRADTPTLRGELAKAIAITAETLQHMGAIWRELEQRGEDLSDLRSGLAGYLPMIASGHLRAEAVVRYAGKAMLLRSIAALPMAEQDQLLKDDAVDVVEIGADGEVKTNKIPLARITSAQVRTAFAPYGLRPQVEQVRAAQAIKKAARRRKPALAPLRIDPKSGYLRRGRSYVRAQGERLHADELASALSAYRAQGEEHADEDEEPQP